MHVSPSGLTYPRMNWNLRIEKRSFVREASTHAQWSVRVQTNVCPKAILEQIYAHHRCAELAPGSSLPGKLYYLAFCCLDVLDLSAALLSCAWRPLEAMVTGLF